MSFNESVQLISTTLQTSPTMKKSNVCRCLFGRPDRGTESSLRDQLKREMDEELGVKKIEWGFDFEMDKPLCNGPYEWTEVSTEDVPAYYTQSSYVSRSKARSGGHPSARLRKNLFSETEPEDASSVLSFSSARLRGHLDSTQSCLSDSSLSPATLNDTQTSNTDPIQKDITTPCVKKLTNLGVSDDLKKSESVCSTGSTSSGSNSTCGVELSKPKVQSSMFDYLRVRKRKASHSPSSRISKSLRRL
ncbi:uncharacterized protein LOC135472759 [Liolophura sinensis]|uniref:uncharacterized protein LOC135472759 n=1 Tax=Liolophura sinensis TaxID=3198878 RepID=UPI003158A901